MKLEGKLSSMSVNELDNFMENERKKADKNSDLGVYLVIASALISRIIDNDSTILPIALLGAFFSLKSYFYHNERYLMAERLLSNITNRYV